MSMALVSAFVFLPALFKDGTNRYTLFLQDVVNRPNTAVYPV